MKDQKGLKRGTEVNPRKEKGTVLGGPEKGGGITAKVEGKMKR